MNSLQSIIDRNLGQVRERMAAAARQSGRSADAVRLVAVTKYVPLEVIQSLVAAGCHDLGENRPQQLVERAQQLNLPAVRWHLIGHWQRNKVRRTLPAVSLLHAGDRLSLLEEISRERSSGVTCGTASGTVSGTASGVTSAAKLPVLLEINISGDPSKHGFAPSDVEPLLPPISRLAGLEVVGLMAMSGLESDATQARSEFAAVRELAERLQQVAPPGMSFGELSMGMSGDFELAIAEGATLVRIGSALYEGLTV